MRSAFLAVFALAACASAPDAELLLEAAEHPSAYEFGHLRFDEPARFAALQREVEAEFARMDAEDARLRTMPAAERPSQCAPDLSAKIAVRAWVNLAAAVPDRATWDRDAGVLRERIRDIAIASVSWRHGAERVDPRARSAHLDDFVRGSRALKIRERVSCISACCAIKRSGMASASIRRERIGSKDCRPRLMKRGSGYWAG